MKCHSCGSNVLEFNRFCTNCGAAMESYEAITRLDAEGRPLQSGFSEYDSNNQSIRRQFAVKAVKPSRIKNRRGFIVALSVLLIVLISVGGYILYKSLDKEEYEHNGEFVLMTKTENTGDEVGELYLGVPGGEEIKLASDALVRYAYTYTLSNNNSRKYIYINEDRNLYEVDEKGSKEKIGSKVVEDYIRPFRDLKKYLFLAGDNNTLYIKYNGEDKVRIASDVRQYCFSYDGNSVFYVDSSENLYSRNKKGHTDKIADDVREVIESYVDNDLIAYVKNDNKLYCTNTSTGETKKLIDGQSKDFLFTEDGSFVYTYEGKLYYLGQDDSDSTQIADNVMYFTMVKDLLVYSDEKGDIFYTKLDKIDKYKLSGVGERGINLVCVEDYIFYVDEKGTLYRTRFGNEEKEKIYEKVESLYVKEEKVYFITTERSLYEVNKDGKITNLRDEVMHVNAFAGSEISYRTNTDDLYIGNKKYQDVINYSAAGENTCYINSNYQLYLIKDKGKPELICEDIRDYSGIYYGGYQAFQVFMDETRSQRGSGIKQ